MSLRARKAPGVRFRMNAKGIGCGAPETSIFAGAPVELPEDGGAAIAVQDPGATDAIVDEAVVDGAPAEVQEQRLAAYDAMSKSERKDVTMCPPLAVDNATIIVRPVVQNISANNLNYLVQKCLVDFPWTGKVKTAFGGQTVTFPDGTQVVESAAYLKFELQDLTGSNDVYKLGSFPFLRLNISASTLNARPGGNYSIMLSGVAENGQIVVTERYTFQRYDATKAITAVMIPFITISTRTLAQLLMFGQKDANDTPKIFEVFVEGMQANEVLTVTAPGYSTSELKEICDVYQLPAGTNY